MDDEQMECNCPDCVWERKADYALAEPFTRLSTFVGKIAMVEKFNRGVAERRYEASKCRGKQERNCGK